MDSYTFYQQTAANAAENDDAKTRLYIRNWEKIKNTLESFLWAALLAQVDLHEADTGRVVAPAQ